MSRWVCCCGDSSIDHPGRGQINSVENDYLLPGSSFDSGSSRSRLGWSSRHSSKKKNANKKPAVTHSVVGLDSPSGNYEPPVVPHSQKLPTYEEFRLLKTVGRGAFGKVCAFDWEALIPFIPLWIIEVLEEYAVFKKKMHISKHTEFGMYWCCCIHSSHNIRRVIRSGKKKTLKIFLADVELKALNPLLNLES